MPAIVEYRNREGRQIAVAALFERGVNNNGSLCERKDRYDSSNLS